MRPIAAVAALVILFAAGCGSKPPQSSNLLSATATHKKSIDFALEGNAVLSEHLMLRAVKTFQMSDSFCNIARVYIVHYQLGEEKANPEYLKDGIAAAAMGTCAPERDILEFLAGTGTAKDLPEPFDKLADFRRTGDPAPLASYAESENLSAYNKSLYFRMAARAYLQSAPAKTEQLVGEAQRIDRFNGWTLNLYRDLNLLIAAGAAQGKDTKALEARKETIEQLLNK